MLRSTSVAILLLPGFDEHWVLQSLTCLQAQGLNARSVSLTAHGVRGAVGLTVQPDLVLPVPLSQTSLIIPECVASLPLLMTEPRIHRVIETVWAEEGAVLVSTSVAAALTRVGLKITKPHNYHVLASSGALAAIVGKPLVG